MSTGVQDVQARIAEIQQRIASRTGQATTSTSDFGDVLNLALSESDSGILGTSTGGDSTSTDMSSLFGDSTNSGGQAAVNSAEKYLGTPYVWGGTDPSKGLDCSGLVQRAYADLGVQLPRVAADQARMGTPVASLAQAKPGDLVAFGSPVDHIGIYAGDGNMVVAPKTGDVVKIEKVYQTPTAIRRILPDDSSTSSGSSQLSMLQSVLGGSNSTSSSTGLASLLSSSGMSAASVSSLLGSSNASTSKSGAISSSLSSQYNSLFTSAGAKYGLSPNLLAAVAKQESGFNPNAGSGAGAQGLMQLMPSTAKSLGVNAYDPAQAVDGAARMLSGLVQKFGSTSLALAAYNAGPGAVTQYGGIPPYKETQNYVKNVLAMSGTSA